MKYLLVGDTHGKLSLYNELVTTKNIPDVVVLGDLGFKKEHDWLRTYYPKHKVLFGNHDYYPYKKEDHSLGDFGMFRNAFFVRGANSIDKHLRILGEDWFGDEELSYIEMQAAIDLYEELRPSIVLSHDCPASVQRKFFGINNTSRTAQGLEIMFRIHRPKTWIFGHHHRPTRKQVKGTKFICLGELESLEINLD